MKTIHMKGMRVSKENASMMIDTLKQSIIEYLNENYIIEIDYFTTHNMMSHAPLKRGHSNKKSVATMYDAISDMSDIDDELEDTFSDTLFQMILDKQIDEVKMYQEAFISKQHFSKMRSDSKYQPKRKTVLLLCVAMKLSIDEANDLMQAAGYAFNHSSKFELIIKYFIEHEIYDFHSIDSILTEYDQETLRKYDT